MDPLIIALIVAVFTLLVLFSGIPIAFGLSFVSIAIETKLKPNAIGIPEKSTNKVKTATINAIINGSIYLKSSSSVNFIISAIYCNIINKAPNIIDEYGIHSGGSHTVPVE